MLWRAPRLQNAVDSHEVREEGLASGVDDVARPQRAEQRDGVFGLGREERRGRHLEFEGESDDDGVFLLLLLLFFSPSMLLLLSLFSAAIEQVKTGTAVAARARRGAALKGLGEGGRAGRWSFVRLRE
jgi:hypothetical protein